MTKFWMGILPLLGVALVAAQKAQPTLLERAKRILAARLIDPSSLQIDPAKVVRVDINGRPETLLCGSYNAKNRFGGYAGPKAFVFEPAVNHGIFTLDLNFFSEDGTGDFNSDAREAIKAGADPDRYQSRLAEVSTNARTYLVACLKGQRTAG